MTTQTEHLQDLVNRATARLGKDALVVKQLQQQLDGYRTSEVNHNLNFMLGTIPHKQEESNTVAGTRDIADGMDRQIAERFGRPYTTEKPKG